MKRLPAAFYLPAAAAAGLEIIRASAGKPSTGVGITDGTLSTAEPGALASSGEGPAGTMTTSMLGALASTTELFSNAAGVGAVTWGEVAATGAETLTAPEGATGALVTLVTGTGDAVTVTLLANALLGAAASCVLTLAGGAVSLPAGAVAGVVALGVLMLIAGMAEEAVTLLVGGAAMTVTLPAGAVAGPAAVAGLAAVSSAGGDTVLVRLLGGVVGNSGIVMLPALGDPMTVPLPASA